MLIQNTADPAYTEWVDQVGDGIPPLNKTVSLEHLSHVYSIAEAADFLFSSDILSDPFKSTLHSFLSSFNLYINEFNQLMMDCVQGAESM